MTRDDAEEISRNHHAGNGIPAEALGFEGSYATLDQIRRIVENDEADASYPAPERQLPEQPPAPGHEERVDLMEGNRTMMSLFIRPEELPC